MSEINEKELSKQEKSDIKDRYESEPCKKEIACRTLRIQDEYFDNNPLPKTKKQHDNFMKEVLKTRQELIKRGYIK